MAIQSYLKECTINVIKSLAPFVIAVNTQGRDLNVKKLVFCLFRNTTLY